MASAKYPISVGLFAVVAIGAAESVHAVGAQLASSSAASQRSNSAAPASPVGDWVMKNGAWTVHIATCPSGICGKIVGLGASPRADVLRKDIQNPNPAKQSATLCGLPVLGGFAPASDPGAWKDGWVYDPESGKTYKSVMELDGPDTLKVRGYFLIPLFGRSETLTRVNGPAERCSNVPGVSTGGTSAG